MSKFSSYEVGYIGDYAGVTLRLVTPIISTSEKPKDKYSRETFTVITNTKSFNSASIVDAVQDALTAKDYSTYVTLLNAQSVLASFIKANGATNPNEAADWAHYEEPAVAQRALAIG